MGYRKGADFERLVRSDLEALGFKVIRSAGSRGPVDLAAMRDGRTVCIQCKLGGVISGKETEKLLDWCTEAGAVPVIAEKCGKGVTYRYVTGNGCAPWTPRGRR